MEYQILLKKDGATDWAVQCKGLMSTDDVRRALKNLHEQNPTGRVVAINVYSGKPYFAI